MNAPFQRGGARAAVSLASLVLIACSVGGQLTGRAAAMPPGGGRSTAPPPCDREWDQPDSSGHCFTTEFRRDECTFATTGRNPFFVLDPGFQVVLEGEEDKELVRVEITVLKETRVVDGVRTRVVEERESKDGELAEVSRNFFARCTETNSIFYFGEEVDFYEDGEIVGHAGAWLAGEDGAEAGIMMPGTILLGSRHYQEIAPGVALDRAEITDMEETIEVPKGVFEGCIVTTETTPLEPKAKELKAYAPRVGIIVDGPLRLVDTFDPAP